MLKPSRQPTPSEPGVTTVAVKPFPIPGPQFVWMVEVLDLGALFNDKKHNLIEQISERIPELYLTEDLALAAAAKARKQFEAFDADLQEEYFPPEQRKKVLWGETHAEGHHVWETNAPGTGQYQYLVCVIRVPVLVEVQP